MALGAISEADPRALEVARAVYDTVLPEKVILFGSRARGDFRADSDIDLLVISDALSKGRHVKAQNAASEAARRVYGERFGVDVVWMSHGKYVECRNGINHLASQAARDGVDMNGEKEEYEPDAERSFDWGDIRQRIINADRELITLNGLVEANMPQEANGFHAQQALENILKGWISAFGAEYGNTHDLGTLFGIIRNNQQEYDTLAGEELTWLTQYAVEYRYEGATLALDDPLEVYYAIGRVVSAVEERIKALTGVEELPRYSPPTRGRRS